MICEWVEAFLMLPVTIIVTLAVFFAYLFTMAGIFFLLGWRGE